MLLQVCKRFRYLILIISGLFLAAHCVRMEYRRVKPNEIVCVFGKLNIKKWITNPGEKMLEPESILIHPGKFGVSCILRILSFIF